MSQLSEQLTHCRLSYSIDLFTHSLTHSHTHTHTHSHSHLQSAPFKTQKTHPLATATLMAIVLATIQFDDDDAMVLALKRAVGCVHRRMGMGMGVGMGV